VRTFEHFVAIDWSGAKGARQKGIAVAICAPGRAAPELVRPGHRWSREEVLDWLLRDLPDESLVGLDLSPALPFDREGGYLPGWDRSPPDARALWRLVDEIAGADANLAATTFVTHPEARRHFRHGKGDCGDRFVGTTGRMRLTEARQRGAPLHLAPQSCFNLVGAAQVGKSSLTGMRLLHGLVGRIKVWPFDPLPEQGSVIVEIYTTIAARAAGVPPGRSKMLNGAALDAALSALDVAAHIALPRYTDHATDAILSAAWLRAKAHDPELWSPAALTPEIARTEGWTFGVP
jgi:hypothetical protein